jgi:hypothetical protein
MSFSSHARLKYVSLVLAAFSCAPLSAQIRWPADLSRLVVAGDSISAGVQNFSLEEHQQIHGYASVLARKAGVTLILPLVPYPGAPNTLELTSLNPLTIVPVPGALPFPPRVNPLEQPTNVSVPGVTLGQALTVLPSTDTPTSPVQFWADIVLGFPNPFITHSTPMTEIQQAVALNPTTVITWLGNNDVLVPAMIGQLDMMTSDRDFATQYKTLLDTLARTRASIVTANIPDVTSIAFFTPVSVVAAQNNMSTGDAARKLNVGPNDLLRPTAVTKANAILNNQGGSLSDPCPAPTALQALTPFVPCVLTADDAASISQRVNQYNTIIFLESAFHLATMADIHGLLTNISHNGYNADGKHLTTGMLGGIFSLDGVHPSNTGYAIIANAFIDTLNTWWGTHIPEANVNAIAAHDPYVPPVKLNYVP